MSVEILISKTRTERLARGLDSRIYERGNIFQQIRSRPHCDRQLVTACTSGYQEFVALGENLSSIDPVRPATFTMFTTFTWPRRDSLRDDLGAS